MPLLPFLPVIESSLQPELPILSVILCGAKCASNDLPFERWALELSSSSL